MGLSIKDARKASNKEAIKDGLSDATLLSERSCVFLKTCQNNFTMDKQTTIKRLKAAQVAIEKALQALDDTSEAATGEHPVGICAFCQKPILAKDDVQREIHARCYKRAREAVKRGETTLEEMENAGLVGPKGTPGRKPLPLPDKLTTRKKKTQKKIDRSSGRDG